MFRGEASRGLVDSNVTDEIAASVFGIWKSDTSAKSGMCAGNTRGVSDGANSGATVAGGNETAFLVNWGFWWAGGGGRRSARGRVCGTMGEVFRLNFRFSAFFENC